MLNHSSFTQFSDINSRYRIFDYSPSIGTVIVNLSSRQRNESYKYNSLVTNRYRNMTHLVEWFKNVIPKFPHNTWAWVQQRRRKTSIKSCITIFFSHMIVLIVRGTYTWSYTYNTTPKTVLNWDNYLVIGLPLVLIINNDNHLFSWSHVLQYLYFSRKRKIYKKKLRIVNEYAWKPTAKYKSQTNEAIEFAVP